MARDLEHEKLRTALTNWITRFREHPSDPVSSQECFDYLVRDRWIKQTDDRDELLKNVIDPVLRRVHTVWRLRDWSLGKARL